MAGPQRRTHYQVLGVRPTAAQPEIRRAHRQLAYLLHPDRQSGSTDAERRLAERRMREVNVAWTTLSDPAKRSAYDRSLVVSGGRPAPTTSPTAPPTGGRSGMRQTGRPEDSDDPDAALARARYAEIDPDEPDLPAGQFWLLRRVPIVLALLVGALLFVVTAYAGGTNDTPGKVDSGQGLVGASDCIRLVEGRNAVYAACDTENDGTIVTEVVQVEDCPEGSKYALLNNEFVCVKGGP